ncbi:MAG: hypothetical protein P8R54_05850 [Myxococcota bacterium]|nr:hypothetical protein [Myxococcota bacterium]
MTGLFQATTDSQVTVSLDNMRADLDIFVVSDVGSGCANCAAFGNTSATFSAQARERWYPVVDVFSGGVSDFDLTMNCN